MAWSQRHGAPFSMATPTRGSKDQGRIPSRCTSPITAYLHRGGPRCWRVATGPLPGGAEAATRRPTTTLHHHWPKHCSVWRYQRRQQRVEPNRQRPWRAHRSTACPAAKPLGRVPTRAQERGCGDCGAHDRTHGRAHDDRARPGSRHMGTYPRQPATRHPAHQTTRCSGLGRAGRAAPWYPVSATGPCVRSCRAAGRRSGQLHNSAHQELGRALARVCCPLLSHLLHCMSKK